MSGCFTIKFNNKFAFSDPEPLFCMDDLEYMASFHYV